MNIWLLPRLRLLPRLCLLLQLESPHAAMFKVGFYKMHPEIPKTMTKNAEDFLLKYVTRCPGLFHTSCVAHPA